MKTIVKLMAFRSKCSKCNEEFRTYDLPNYSYGERIMLSEDGIDYSYINCIDDSVFDEVSNLVSDLRNDPNEYSSQNTDCFNKIFGYACDRINGKVIDASRSKRTCQFCGSEDLKSWEYEPPIIEEKEIYLITHNEWFSLTKEKRRELVRMSLDRIGCI